MTFFEFYFSFNKYFLEKKENRMSQYRVIPGPVATGSAGIMSMIFGPNTNTSGSAIQAIIEAQANEGYELVTINDQIASGKCCFIIPKNVNVKLLVFKK